MDRIQELENRMTLLEKAENIDASELQIDRLVKKTSDVTDANVTNAIGGEGGNTFDFPDIWLNVEYKGKVYKVPGYLLSRFTT